MPLTRKWHEQGDISSPGLFAFPRHRKHSDALRASESQSICTEDLLKSARFTCCLSMVPGEHDLHNAFSSCISNMQKLTMHDRKLGRWGMCCHDVPCSTTKQGGEAEVCSLVPQMLPDRSYCNGPHSNTCLTAFFLLADLTSVLIANARSAGNLILLTRPHTPTHRLRPYEAESQLTVPRPDTLPVGL